jgi:predicted Zn-ribbon and HTH transcriptional regulator
MRHVVPSTDTKPELTAKASMAQPVSQPAVYANGLNMVFVWMIKEKEAEALEYIHPYICKFADPSGRAAYGVGLRPLDCRDCGFESHRVSATS